MGVLLYEDLIKSLQCELERLVVASWFRVDFRQDIYAIAQSPSGGWLFTHTHVCTFTFIVYESNHDQLDICLHACTVTV